MGVSVNRPMLPETDPIAALPAVVNCPSPELVRRVSEMIVYRGKSAAALADEIAADLLSYEIWHCREAEAETALKDAAARGDISIFGHPVDPEDPFQLRVRAGSRLEPIAAVVFAEDGGGFRQFSDEAATYGARLRSGGCDPSGRRLPGGFDPAWSGGSWTRLKLKADDVLRLWPINASKSGPPCDPKPHDPFEATRVMKRLVDGYVKAGVEPTRDQLKAKFAIACPDYQGTIREYKAMRAKCVPPSWQKGGLKGTSVRAED